MDEETDNMPLIQIGDVVRPMTDEEYQAWVELKESTKLPLA